MVLKKENSEFKSVKSHLRIDLVSYTAHAEKLGKYIHQIWDAPSESTNYYQ